MLNELEAWSPSVKLLSAEKDSFYSDMSKTALGPLSMEDEAEGRKLAGQAIKLARVYGKLPEAADMMEEAINKCVGLREQYEYFIKVWRDGKIS